MKGLGAPVTYVVELDIQPSMDDVDSVPMAMWGASSCVKHRKFEDIIGGCSDCYYENNSRYVITGVDRMGRRFKPIHTNTPQHYNIWQGTIWEKLPDGRRKKIQGVWN